MKLLLLLFVVGGCSPAPTRVEAIAVADSVRYVQAEKDQPYALRWKDGTTNLWRRADSWMVEQSYPYQHAVRYRYSVVYKAKLPPYYLASLDTVPLSLVASGDVQQCTVDGGAGWIVCSGDTALRGLCVTRVSVPSCGARDDSVWLDMARADQPEVP